MNLKWKQLQTHLHVENVNQKIHIISQTRSADEPMTTYVSCIDCEIDGSVNL